MPKGDWGHKTYGYRPECRRVFPELEHTPDLSRGEIRLASEAMLARLQGETVPDDAMSRALSIASVMARG